MRVRTAIVTVMMTLVTAGAVQAQAVPSARQMELARRYVAAMQMERTFDATMDAMTPALMDQGVKLPPEKQAEVAAMIRDVTKETVVTMSNRMAPLLAEVFTEKELEDVVAFYEGPSGRSMIEKSPQLAAKMAPMMREMMPQVRARMIERICRISECPPALVEQFKP